MRLRTLGIAAAVSTVVALADVGGAGAAGPKVAPRSAAARPAPAPPRLGARPNFTGTWKLDTLRSSFGKTPGTRPRSRVDVIEHREPHLVETLFLVRESGKDTTTYRYAADSSESVNTLDGQEIKTRVWWEGTVLHLDSRTRIMVLEATLKDRWSLSADGKSLSMKRHIKSFLGEDDQTLVFEKQ